MRNMRLEKATYLLKHSELNVNEVVFETGFVNNSHFSKIFKLKYSSTPSEYNNQYSS
ncbi:MAG: helix-turn-helix domain-containing protein [Bacteroides xylanisolvens]